MYPAVLSFNPSKKRTLTFFIFLSLLLAAYTPMASISSAQSAIDASALDQLRTKALDVITERIKNFQATIANLGVTVSVDEGNASSPSPTASPAAMSTIIPTAQSGLDANVDFPTALKTQSKDFLQRIVDELTQMKTKVTDASSLTTMQSLSSNLDAQSGLNQLANVQAAVTQSVQSLTGVFGNLQTTANNLQGQVTQLVSCTKDTDANQTTADCQGLNTTNTDVATSAQSQLDNIGTVMTTISSVLMSAIALLTTLITSFIGIAGGLGGGGSLGNLSSLSSMTNLGDISKLTGSLGGITGLLTSFTGMTSQLDIASGMGGNAGGLLSSLSSLINI